MTTKTKTRDEVTALFQDLNKPSLHALSYALRHPDTWPVGFVWNYNKCKQCAMGLAHQLWGVIAADNMVNHGKRAISDMAREFAMPYGKASDIFLADNADSAPSWVPSRSETTGMLFWKETKIFTNLSAVTPDMVADQIDKYLKTVE